MNDGRFFEKTLSSQTVYEGKIVHLYKDTVLLPNGKEGIREHIRHVGAACVVPLTANYEVLLVRQFRYPFSAVLTEIPAGKLDGKNEDPYEAALRELREETGANANELVDLGVFYPTCAYTDERIHMYLALDVAPGEQALDEDEFVEYELVPIGTLVDRIMNGELPDGKTQTAVLKAYLYLRRIGRIPSIQG